MSQCSIRCVTSLGSYACHSSSTHQTNDIPIKNGMQYLRIRLQLDLSSFQENFNLLTVVFLCFCRVYQTAPDQRMQHLPFNDFIYILILHLIAAKALARLPIWAGSSEHSLLDNAKNTKIASACPYYTSNCS